MVIPPSSGEVEADFPASIGREELIAIGPTVRADLEERAEAGDGAVRVELQSIE